MAAKNKGGREARKPKAAEHKKQKGQPPTTPAPAVTAINHPGAPKK